MPQALYQLTPADFDAYYGQWCRDGGPPKPVPTPHPWSVQVPGLCARRSQQQQAGPRRHQAAQQHQQQHEGSSGAGASSSDDGSQEPSLLVNLFELYETAVELQSSRGSPAPALVWSDLAARGVAELPAGALAGDQLLTVCALYLLPFMEWLDDVVHEWQTGEQQQQDDGGGMVLQQPRLGANAGDPAAARSPRQQQQQDPDRRQLRQRQARQQLGASSSPSLQPQQTPPPPSRRQQSQQQQMSPLSLPAPQLLPRVAVMVVGAAGSTPASAAALQLARGLRPGGAAAPRSGGLLQPHRVQRALLDAGGGATSADALQQLLQPAMPVTATAAATTGSRLGSGSGRRAGRLAVQDSAAGTHASADEAAPTAAAGAAAAAAAAAALVAGGSSDSDSTAARGQQQRPRRAALTAAAAAIAAISGSPHGSPLRTAKTAAATAAAARDTESPVPGDPLHSIVSWLRGASLELAQGSEQQQAAAASRTQALASKYRPLTARLRTALAVPVSPAEVQKLMAAARRLQGQQRQGQHQGARRSRRDRKQASFYSPGGYRLGVPTYVNPYAIKEGSQHQAVVPEGPRALPHKPDAREARYLTAPVYTPAAPAAAAGGAAAGTQRQGSFGQWLQQPLLAAAGLAGSSRAAAGGHGSGSSGANPALTQLTAGQFRRQYQAAGSGGARRALLAEWVDKADGVLGPQLAEALGVSRLGAKLAPEWPLAQQLLFALGMLDTKYRNFPYRGFGDKINLDRIQRRYLPGRSVNALNAFYYNVWKNLASPLAQEFEDAISVPTRAFCAAPDSRPPPGLASQALLYRQQLLRRLQVRWDEGATGPLPPAAAAGIAALAATGAPAAAGAAAAGPGGGGSNPAVKRPRGRPRKVQPQGAPQQYGSVSPSPGVTPQPPSRSMSPLVLTGADGYSVSAAAAAAAAAWLRRASHVAGGSGGSSSSRQTGTPMAAAAAGGGAGSSPGKRKAAGDPAAAGDADAAAKRRRTAQPSDLATAATSAAAAALSALQFAAFALVGPAAVSGRASQWLRRTAAAAPPEAQPPPAAAAGAPKAQASAQQEREQQGLGADADVVRRQQRKLLHLARHPSKVHKLAPAQLQQLQRLLAVGQACAWAQEREQLPAVAAVPGHHRRDL